MRKFYLVKSVRDYRTADHLEHGYETECDYRRALRILQSRFAGRVGECVDEKHGFLRLRFTDTPDASPVYGWFPPILLAQTEPPEQDENLRTETAKSPLDEIFGFD